MLGKLLKYEIKSTARIFIPLYALLLVFALLNKFLNPFEVMESSVRFNFQSVFQALTASAYFILIVAIFVMTLFIAIQRFYKNLLGDEGYLMFTLPVKTRQNIASKLLIAVMWYILSAVAVITSIAIMVGPREFFEFLQSMIELLKDGLGVASLIILPLFILIQLIHGTLMIYDAMSLGHLFGKQKLLASFGMYAALYFITQIILTIVILSVGSTMFTSLIHSAEPTGVQILSFLGMLGIVAALLSVVHFAITNYILKNKLNLE
ncbi:MAG: ABC transporter permease [Clostridia bacterium]|nr:ABC transporter permease [Clostridia bacterium]